jgi:selenocysteine-specific elongation factor
VIVATAGHVDHGKTLLVRALTGIDTDRLAEEKRRGMTIDLGFAYTDFGGPEPTGFVDVPGHERFVRNMLAGLSRVDLALLVIAADDGPMPQTREHLAILGLAGATSLVVVLTKIDRVDAGQLAAARDQITALLAATPYAGAPVFPVDTPGGRGLQALREHIAAMARAAPPGAPRGHFRMSIDRAFIVTGAGLVVTGTVLTGAAAVGDALRLSPEGGAVRVRGVHANGRPADRAREGQRCALNIAGAQLRADQVARGHWLVAEAVHAPSARIDVRLSLIADGVPAPARRAALQVHLGAAAIGATLVPIAPLDASDGAAAPARGVLAQLVLERPVSALRGDRFVLRDPAGQRTLGGGEVIDPWGPTRGRARAGRIGWLRAMARPDATSALSDLLELAPAGVDAQVWARAWNLDTEQAAAACATAGALRLRPAGHELLLARPAWAHWRDAIVESLADEHAAHPERTGAPEAELLRAACVRRRARAGNDAPWPERARDAQAIARLAAAELGAEGALARAGMRLRLPGHEPRLPAADAALLARALPLLREALLRPPIVGELASALGIPREDALAFMRRMGALGHVLAVAPNRFFAPEALPALGEIARALAEGSPDGSFDAAAYRDASGIGRNLTIEVLEFLDRAGVTVFAGERRRLARAAAAP